MHTGEHASLSVAGLSPAGEVHAPPNGRGEREASALMGSSTLAAQASLAARTLRTNSSAISTGSGSTTLARVLAGDRVALGVAPTSGTAGARREVMFSGP